MSPLYSALAFVIMRTRKQTEPEGHWVSAVDALSRSMAELVASTTSASHSSNCSSRRSSAERMKASDFELSVQKYTPSVPL